MPLSVATMSFGFLALRYRYARPAIVRIVLITVYWIVRVYPPVSFRRSISTPCRLSIASWA
jgi:hypothetical protein